MGEKCLCESNETIIFSCAGSSNVGQIANQAAVNLSKECIGRYFCLAGIGAHVSGMLESTKSARMLVVIDGCPVACAKKILEHTGFNIDEYTQITDLGIEKNHQFNLEASDVQKVVNHMSSLVSKKRRM